MVIVDSSCWIEACRPRGSLEVKAGIEGLLTAYKAQLCAPVRLEVLGGAREVERRPLSLYLSIIPYRRCEPADWEHAISLAWRLRGRGLNLPWLDILIAAIALHDKRRIYTVDKHFDAMQQAIPELQLYQPHHGGRYRREDDA